MIMRFLAAAALLLTATQAHAGAVQPPGPQPTTCAGGSVTAYPGYGQVLTCGTPAASGTINSGTINDLGFYAATGTAISGLATANSSVLVTSAGGVPSLATTLPSGLVIPAPALSGTITGSPTLSGTITFSGTVAGAALTSYLASPAAIGGTAAAAGAFTTLGATGAVTLSGLSVGTQVDCVGLSSGNTLVLSSGACGSGGGSTTITLGSGLGNSQSVYNTGTQTVTNGSTIFPQVFYKAITVSCTVNTNCSAGTSDSAYEFVATAANVTYTLPNPGVVGNAPFNFGSDGTHSYIMTTSGGTATFYGCGLGGNTSMTVTVNIDVMVTTDGTNYKCSEFGGGGVIGPGSSTNNDLAAFNGTTGGTIKDSGVLTSNVPLLNGNQSFTAGQAITASALTMSAATVATNAALSNNFTGLMVHADSPYTFSNPTNLTAGQVITYVLTESATGGDTVGTWGANFNFPNGTPLFNTAANAKNTVSCIADSGSTLQCFGPSAALTGPYSGSGASAIPACAVGLEGSLAYVTDGAASPTYNGAYTAAAGSTVVPVFCSGSAWTYH
ncbi:MAG: hypothetical protein ACRD0I_12570 [Acidimicrobiales bacterium]